MSDIIRITSIQQIHDFWDLESPRHPLITVLPITDEMTNYDYGGKTYAMELYHVSLKQGISGSLAYGRNSYDFHDGTMTFLKPEQIIKIEQTERYEESSGWTLIFHPDLLRKSDLGKNIDNYSFFEYEVSEALHLSKEERVSLTELVQKIENEYRQNIDKHSQELIISNIDLLLKYCERYYDRQFYTRSNLNKDVVAKFEKLLRAYFASESLRESGLPTVKLFAEQLSYSPNYLSDLLVKETGKNTQEHIHSFVINQAKNRLLNSELSISELAYQLGFDYPEYFSKLFKKKTGMTPAKYRSLN